MANRLDGKVAVITGGQLALIDSLQQAFGIDDPKDIDMVYHER